MSQVCTCWKYVRYLSQTTIQISGVNVLYKIKILCTKFLTRKKINTNMSRSSRKNTKIPKGWLGCPQNGNSLIADTFMTLKTPLSNIYSLPSGDKYLPKDIFIRARRNNVKIGLWIDLTNTDRYYNPADVEYEGCEYVKLPCQGHGSCPSFRETNLFISTVYNFLNRRPDECIAVHCTHGFNRTGFLIVAYLVEKMNFNVISAVEAFIRSRPGIYRPRYITELFKRYGRISDAPPPPRIPAWAL